MGAIFKVKVVEDFSINNRGDIEEVDECSVGNSKACSNEFGGRRSEIEDFFGKHGVSGDCNFFGVERESEKGVGDKCQEADMVEVDLGDIREVDGQGLLIG